MNIYVIVIKKMYNKLNKGCGGQCTFLQLGQYNNWVVGGWVVGRRNIQTSQKAVVVARCGERFEELKKLESV